MPLITDLLKSMRQLESQKPTPTDTEVLDGLWYIIGVPKGFHNLAPDAGYEGDSQAVTDFVTWFRALIARQKVGSKTLERVNALDIILTDLIGKPAGAFPKIDANKFAFQLALRVREPRLINQKSTNLCGPNSLLIQLAKDRPTQYVLIAIQLLLTGKSSLDRMEIEPSYMIRSFYNEDAIGECDYVVLGSIRDSAAILLGDGIVRNIGLLTKPGVLCDWLRKAGYSEVEDHTFFDLPGYAKPVDAITSGRINAPRPSGFASPTNPAEKIKNLQAAAAKLGGGKRVIMNAEAKLSADIVGAGTVTDSGLTGPSNAMETHWCWVQKLTLSTTQVSTIKIYTWGGSFSAANIPLSDFVSRYSGFVSYDDGLITPTGAR